MSYLYRDRYYTITGFFNVQLNGITTINCDRSILHHTTYASCFQYYSIDHFQTYS